MTDIPPLPGEVGVRMVPPPAEQIPIIEDRIAKAIESIGDADMGLFAVADRKGGWNLAYVAKVEKGKHRFAVVSWAGKDWGSDESLDFGVQAMWTMKFNSEKETTK